MTETELQKEAEEYVSPEVWGDTYYENRCGDWENEDMQKAYIDGRKKSEEQIDYQQSVIRTQHETINELQRYREAIDSIASVCDLVLCGATNWDEEQLDEHFETVQKIVRDAINNVKDKPKTYSNSDSLIDIKSSINAMETTMQALRDINDKSENTKIITPTEIKGSNDGIIVYTETQIYPVLPKSSAALYLWNFHHDGPCKVSINKDGYIYLAEKAEIPRC